VLSIDLVHYATYLSVNGCGKLLLFCYVKDKFIHRHAHGELGSPKDLNGYQKRTVAPGLP
jgi:hypothetical protein